MIFSPSSNYLVLFLQQGTGNTLTSLMMVNS